MKVRIIRPTIAQKRQVYPGDELEVSKEEAVQLIGANKAVAVKTTAVVETADQPLEAVETSVVETPEIPAAPKRGKTKKASE
jgi:hypothetical protein